MNSRDACNRRVRAVSHVRLLTVRSASRRQALDWFVEDLMPGRQHELDPSGPVEHALPSVERPTSGTLHGWQAALTRSGRSPAHALPSIREAVWLNTARRWDQKLVLHGRLGAPRPLFWRPPAEHGVHSDQNRLPRSGPCRQPETDCRTSLRLLRRKPFERNRCVHQSWHEV